MTYNQSIYQISAGRADIRMVAFHDIDLKYLKVFVTVVECHGFTNAEAILDINCSSISKYISSLETRLGVRLCNRGRGGFELTPEGEEYYQSALRLLKSIEQHAIDTNNLKLKSTSSITLGVIDNIAQDPDCHVHDAMRTFTSKQTNVDFKVVTCSADEIILKLINNEIDIGISYISRRISGLESRFLYEEMSYPYISSTNQNTDEKHITALEDVKELGLATCTHEKSNPILSFAKNINICNHLDSVALLTLSGEYIGLIPEHYAQYWTRKKQLKKLDIKQLCLVSSIYVLYKTNSVEQPLVKEFIELLLAEHT